LSVDAKLDRGLQTERIDGRKDWARYVQLKTALHRAHVADVESELASILDALLRREKRRAESS
jgi:hypothetical protein